MRSVALVGGAVLLAGAPAAAAAPLTLSPTPGTPAASPKTSVSILGVAPGRVQSVAVVGASSGAHGGRIRRVSDDRGVVFAPNAPFKQGERVRVVVRVRDRRAVRFSFRIARLGPIPPVIKLTATQPDKLEQFVSEPDLTPPRITVLKPAPTLAGDIFLTPLPSPVVHPGSTQTVTIKPVGPGGPMIIDGSGRLVWFKQITPPDVAANLRVQRYRGRRVLTWWQGPVTFAAFGLGVGVIADSSYKTIRTVHAGNGYEMDIHEFSLTPEGDALFTIYSPIMVHLPGTPAGKLSPLLDAIVQAVDVRTGLVTWEWHAFGHIPLAESYATPENSASYDAYHFNSVQPLAKNRVLVSARDTSAVYEVERATGRIRWTLGGKASDFRLGPGAKFWLQHHAQMLSGNRVSVFDDQAGPPQKAPASRGLVLALDLRRRTARVVRQYHRAPDTSAQSEGSVQQLPGGDAFVGFGSTPFFSQFSATGRLLFDASLPEDDGSYRVYRFNWTGTPSTLPAIAARRVDASTVAIYASWNGATGVAQWRVLAGQFVEALAPVATAARTGFETRIDVQSTANAFAVLALDADGKVLATSPVVGAP